MKDSDYHSLPVDLTILSFIPPSIFCRILMLENYVCRSEDQPCNLYLEHFGDIL